MRPGLKWTLVILRLAIGWHFLFEGLDKLRSLSLGPTEFNRPWTSATFLREAPGPVGPWLRRLADGEPDWLDSEDGRNFARVAPGWEQGWRQARKLPEALERDWESYRQRFIAHYRIDDPKLVSRVQDAYRNAEIRAIGWLLGPKTGQAGQAVSSLAPSPVNQIEAYQRQQARINEMEQQEFPAFGHDVRHGQLREARAEARRLAADLHAGWAKQTELMHKDLERCLDESQRALGPLPEAESAHTVGRLDRWIAWGLSLVGACMLLGFMTRPACLFAACFLAFIYLAYPPWPSMPDNPHVDGRNIFVDQNLIEMLALFVLTMVPSGRWLGLDALVFLLFSRKTPRLPPASEAAPS
jgi:uncharacterized membrane protein YphA (DoxX/SURF4 family)